MTTDRPPEPLPLIVTKRERKAAAREARYQRGKRAEAEVIRRLLLALDRLNVSAQTDRPEVGEADGLHDCPANGCGARIDFTQMCCKRHWFALPPDLRRRVNQAWRNGDVRATITARRDVGTFLNGSVQ